MKLSELLESLKPGDTILMMRTVLVSRKDGSGTYTMVVTEEDQQEIMSKPPSGHFTVINLYVDSGTGKLVVEYDNTPAP